MGVRVQVCRVDLDGRRIDFRLVRVGDAERPAERGKADRAEPAARAAVSERVADRPAIAVEELAVVRVADRALKAVARERKSAAGKATRKTGARKPAAKGRGSRR